MANIIICDMCGKRLDQEDYYQVVTTNYLNHDPSVFSKGSYHSFCTECLNKIRESIRAYRNKRFGCTVPRVMVLLDEFIDPYGDCDVKE